MKFIIVLLISLVLTASTVPVAHAQTRKSRTRKTAVKPTPKLTMATSTPSGLIYIITKRSQGRLPLKGETVAVNYTGLLTNGTKFDSSLDRGEPIKFKLGVGRVIKGWDEGIAKLRVGEQATLIIPSHLGYGAKGAGDVIPPEATLVFIVELVGIEEVPATR